MNLVQITPFIHVTDLKKALAFFTGILGFKVEFNEGNYAYVSRENAAIRILESEGNEGAPPGNRRYAYYIDVQDVDALYAELKPKLDTLPPGDVHGLCDQSYGQRAARARAGRQPSRLRRGDKEIARLPAPISPGASTSRATAPLPFPDSRPDPRPPP